MNRQTAIGAALMVGGMAIIGLIDNFIRHIAAEGSLWQFHALRSTLACATMLAFAFGFGWPILPKQLSAVAIRSACGGAAMAIYFGALGYLPIAQAGAGMFTAPIFVLIISALFLGERIGPVRIMAGLAGFAGALMVLRPDPSDMNWLALAPVLAGALWALTGITTKTLCAEESTLAVLFGFFVTLGLIGLAGLAATAAGFGDGQSFVTRGWGTPSASLWFWIAVQAFGSLLAIAMLVRAYQIGETSYIALFEYSFLIFASFWGWTLYGEALEAMALAGLAIILGAGAVITWRSEAAEATP